MDIERRTTRRNPGRGLSEAERADRFRAIAAALAVRLRGRPVPAIQPGPPDAAARHARALGLARRIARLRRSG